LGRFFTFTAQTSPDQPVISAGPCRVISHPGYAGCLLAIVGVGFLFDNWATDQRWGSRAGPVEAFPARCLLDWKSGREFSAEVLAVLIDWATI
jgi:hypothetical protein